MFDSVLDRGVAPRRRLATGAWVSVLGHAAVLSAALMVRPPAMEKIEQPTIIFPPVKAFVPDVPKGTPNGGGARVHSAASATPKRREVLAPAAIPKPFNPEIVAPPDEPIEGRVIGDASKGEGGDEEPFGDPDGDPKVTAKVPGEFRAGSGMTAPVLREPGRKPQYTLDALETHVEGLMTVRCLVTLEGRLRECQALHSLPYMERAVVEALMTRRYSPAKDHGTPVEVFYTFRVKLELPQ